MTVTDVAFGSAWPARGGPAPPRLMVAAFAVAFAGWGLVGLAVRSSDNVTYEAIARDNGYLDATSFLVPAGDPAARLERVTPSALVEWHDRWSAYVLGRASVPPRSDPPAFTPEETGHMADVRAVFTAAQALMLASAVAAIVLVGFALGRGPRTMGLLLRNGAGVAAAAVLAIGLVAAVAFEPAFLAFHYVFFPQGNFLFPPTSNLLRLYPEAYWYSVTLRVGGAFVAAATAVALVGWLLARSGIVTRR